MFDIQLLTCVTVTQQKKQNVVITATSDLIPCSALIKTYRVNSRYFDITEDRSLWGFLHEMRIKI